MIVLRLVAILSNEEELVRHIEATSIKDVLHEISTFMSQLQANTFHANDKTQVIKFLVQSQKQCQDLCDKPISVVNMCGKITHEATLYIHNPGVKAYVKKEKNNFGVSMAVYTRFCNFHTGNNKSSTLFRAGTSSKSIGKSISHVFISDNLLDVVVTNIVYNARMGRPVSAKNTRIFRALQHLNLGSVMLCTPLEECMFVHCFKQEISNQTALQNAGLHNMQEVSVRINICHTGTVNFFFGLPGGVELSLDPEIRVLSLCDTLLQAVVDAT